MAAPGSEIDVALEELEARLERLRSLYEQYFIGIEKIEPSIPRQDVDRRIYALRKTQIRNTAKRFRLQNIIQRYNTFQQYWLRICREIENGTYHRHVARAQSRFGDVPLTAAARRRARVPSADKDQQKDVADQKERLEQSAEDDFNALLAEEPEAALQRALAAAEQVVVKVAARADEAAAAALASSAATVTSGRGPPPRPSAKGRQPPGQAAGGQAAGAQAGNVAPAGVASGGAPAVGVPAAAAGTSTGTVAAKPAARAAGAPPPRRPRVPERARPNGVPSVAPSSPAEPRAPAREAAPEAALPGVSVGAQAARPAEPARPEAAGRPSRAVAATAGATHPAQRRRSSSPARATAAAAKASTAPGAQQQKPRDGDDWAALRNPSAPQRTQHPARPEPGRLDGRVSTHAPRVDTDDRTGLPTRSTVSHTGMVRPPAATSSSGLNAATSSIVPAPVRAESAAPVRLPTAPAGARAPVATAGSPSDITSSRSALPRASATASDPSANAAAAAAAREAAKQASELRAQPRAGATSCLDDQRLDQLHGALVAERRRLNQPGKVSREALGASLRETESRLTQQYSGKPIDFHVVVKDGKAVVKPIIG